MTPLPLSTPEEQSPPPSQADRPERSRNGTLRAQCAVAPLGDDTEDSSSPCATAKAQARHRAKRKAYIEQLEQTVTKLQYALSLSPDQVAVLPPPIVRIRELEEQNKELVRQIDELRTQLEDRNTRVRTTTVHRSHSGPVLPTFDDRGSDHDTVKRRRTVEGSDDLLMHGQHNSHDHIHVQRVHPASPSYPTVLHPYARAAPQYDHVVKIEEDAYPMQHGLATQTNMSGYSTALSSFGGNNPAMGNWHGYGDGA
ncbi:hypothetical protein EIP86_009359 [Pleurotus ostreatoroseus]|nr:hypothetical protein EIP86_009359 [Pleurotus ostreatoroseus]